MAFLDRLNDQQSGNLQNGWEYALPTEAQWEYARRAGSTSTWGSFDASDPSYDLSIGDVFADSVSVLEFNGSMANYNSHGSTPFSYRDVGHYPPNPWGFHEMSGNAAEWVADWYGPYSSDSLTDPLGPSSGTKIKESTRLLQPWNPIGKDIVLVSYKPVPPVNSPPLDLKIKESTRLLQIRRMCNFLPGQLEKI